MFSIILGIIVAFICWYILFFIYSKFLSKFPNSGHASGHFQPDVKCPDCGTIAPRTRLANSMTQILLGGWTCEKCDCEFDGFGKKR